MLRTEFTKAYTLGKQCGNMCGVLKTCVLKKTNKQTVCSLCHRDPTLGIFVWQRIKNPEEGIRKHKDVSIAFFINNIKKVYDQLHLFHSLNAISSEDYMASM